jgi:hypothetical protein
MPFSGKPRSITCSIIHEADEAPGEAPSIATIEWSAHLRHTFFTREKGITLKWAVVQSLHIHLNETD